jgi:hypothetical protein
MEIRFLAAVRRWSGPLLLAGAGAVASAPARAGLQIDATFDSSITSLSNAVAVENTISNAISFYEATFTNPITVAIDFQATTTGLGGSSSALYGLGYSTYKSALETDYNANPANATKASANANLPTSIAPNNIAATAANLQALGFTLASPPTFDGTIYLNTSLMSFNADGSATTGLYYGNSVIQHEIDEVLGIGGAGSSLGQSSLTGYYGATDLFRYSSVGTLSHTTNSSASTYFSIDGGHTSLVAFNQTGGGSDYGDWKSPPTGGPPDFACVGTIYVQDAYGCTGGAVSLTLGSPEAVALQAIGYDVAAAPEPESYTMLLAGLGLLGVIARRRGRQQAT